MKLRNKQEIIFIATSILLSLMVVGFIVYSIDFLATNTGRALNQSSINPNGIAKFNLEGLKQLGIMK